MMGQYLAMGYDRVVLVFYMIHYIEYKYVEVRVSFISVQRRFTYATFN